MQGLLNGIFKFTGLYINKLILCRPYESWYDQAVKRPSLSQWVPEITCIILLSIIYIYIPKYFLFCYYFLRICLYSNRIVITAPSGSLGQLSLNVLWLSSVQLRPLDLLLMVADIFVTFRLPLYIRAEMSVLAGPLTTNFKTPFEKIIYVSRY